MEKVEEKTEQIIKAKKKPRGGNSPVIGDNGICAAPGDIAKITREALEVGLVWPPIDNKDPEQLQKRAMDYFNYCIEHDSRPGNMELYSAWGVDRRRIYEDLAREPNSPRTVTIKKSLAVLSAVREKLMSTGKINPVTGIFWQKNFDGLEDRQTMEITPKQDQEPELTPDEVQAQLEQDIPIDADYTEI